MLEAGEPLFRLLECLGRDVDEVHAGVPAARLQRLREEDELFAAAAPELHDRRACGCPFGVEDRVPHDLGRVACEQPPFGARDVVPREPANRVEQARAERVVEVLRLQLSGNQLQIPRDVRREISAERPF
jgi:hypothetical protein